MKNNAVDYRLSAGELSVTISKSSSGIMLSSLEDLRTGTRFLTKNNSLFILKAKNLSNGEIISTDSTDSWKDITVQNSSEESFSVILSANDTLPNISITLYAKISNNKISWKTFLQNNSDELTLIECDYPALTFDIKDSITMFTPYGSGELRSTTQEDRLASEQNYPSYGASMQYLAFWDDKTRRGIYYGAHDPAPAYKKISFVRDDDEKDLTFKFILPLSETDRTGNSQELFGKCVWQLFDGDWYDAAIIYRDWAFKEASWTVRGIEIPEWIKKTNHWWLVHDKEGFKAEDIATMDKDLGVNSSTHIYYWHEIPFDNDYPHYFPIRENFQQEISKLKELGIPSMPYINGRLWDTRDKGAEDWQFTSLAKPFATKTLDGDAFVETYSSTETDGSKVALAIMCPSTALWQEKMKEITIRLFDEVGVDAIYIDQIAAAKPNLCEDRSHNHPAGGGRWWCDSYANLLDHICRSMPDGRALTTECTADPFMRYMSAYLGWLWIRNDQVPAFTAIYSDYMPVFGLSYGSLINSDETCIRVFTAMSLVYGMQMGWIKPQQYQALPCKDFYKKLVQFRAKLSGFFSDGIMLRPPFIKDNAPRMISDKSAEMRGRLIDYPAVQGALWQNNINNEKILILVNASDVDATADVETEFADGTYMSKGDIREQITIKDGCFSVTLPKSSVVYLIK